MLCVCLCVCVCVHAVCMLVCVCVCVRLKSPVEVVREEAVALLNDAVPVQQLLVRLALVPLRCSGRHAVTTFRTEASTLLHGRGTHRVSVGTHRVSVRTQPSACHPQLNAAHDIKHAGCSR